MSNLKLKITSTRPTSFCTELQSCANAQGAAQKIINYLTSLTTGSERHPTMQIEVQESMVAASGSFTLVNVIATDAVTINGVTFTCVASGATGNQFNKGLTDTATATNLAAAINGCVTDPVNGMVIAVGVSNVVELASSFYGIAGNQTAIASLDTTITASGAHLTGGTDDVNVVTYCFQF